MKGPSIMLDEAQHKKHDRFIWLCVLASILLLIRFVWLPVYQRAINNKQQLYQLNQLLSNQNNMDQVDLANAYYQADSATSAGSQLLAMLQMYAENSGYRITSASIIADEYNPDTIVDSVLVEIRGESNRLAFLKFIHQLSHSRPVHIIEHMQLNAASAIADTTSSLRVSAIWQSLAPENMLIAEPTIIKPVISWTDFSRICLLGLDQQPVTTAEIAPPEIPTGLKLVGIITGSPHNVAIFKLANGEQRAVTTGDIIAGTQLHRILADRVILQIDTANLTMFIE